MQNKGEMELNDSGILLGIAKSATSNDQHLTRSDEVEGVCQEVQIAILSRQTTLNQFASYLELAAS